MRVLKWIGGLLGGLLLLLVVAAFVLMALGASAADRRHRVPEQVLADARTGDPVRGEHLSQVLACRECHGDRLQGREMIDAPPLSNAPAPRQGLPGPLQQTPELDAWIRINAEETVTVFTGKVEIG